MFEWKTRAAIIAGFIFAVGCGGPQVSAPATEPGSDDAQRGDAGPRWGQDDIENGMASIGPALVECYKTAVSANRHESGSVIISASIASNGHVDSATPVESSLSQGFVGCLAGVIRSAQFRPPGFEGVRVRIPLTFKQEDAGAP